MGGAVGSESWLQPSLVLLASVHHRLPAAPRQSRRCRITTLLPGPPSVRRARFRQKVPLRPP